MRLTGTSDNGLSRRSSPLLQEPIKEELPKLRAIAGLLTGQKAIVTGANSGIGKAIAIALAQAGADVIVNYIQGDDAAAEVVDTINSNGRNAIAIKADVSNEVQVQAMFRTAVENFGTVDILVNNAALQRDAAFDQ